MRKFLMTTALVLPLGVGAAFAQQAEEAETELEQGAEQAGEAVEDAAEEAGEAVQEGAEAVEEGAEEAAEAVEETAEEGAAEVEAEATAEAGEGEAIVREQSANELRVDWITGTTVRAADGSTIGDINDLIIDGETSEMNAAIVGVGGFLGIGQKQIAVAWDQLQINYDANEITSSITREEADAAPEYVFRDQEQAPPPAGMEPATGAVPADDPGTTTMGTEPAPAD